jgi:hydroxyacylglutathione hydrolase
MLSVHQFTFNPFQENTFIIANAEKECIIIDPGMFQPNEYAEFYGAITQMQLKPIMVVNTHAHLDHIFGVQGCVDRYEIPFLLTEKELPVLAHAEQAGIKYGVPVLHPPKPTNFLAESGAIKIGEDVLEILFVPGHSPGHVCLYSAKDEFVIAGDTLFSGSIGRTDLPGGNHDQLIQAIHQQLLVLPTNTKVYCGHNEPTFIGIEQMNNPFLR